MHRQRLIYAARRLLDSRADAEDAVQDTYLRSFDAHAGWQEPEPAWLHAVLRNIAIDRRRRRLLETKHADVDLSADESSDFEAELRCECEAALRRLLARVSPEEAAALLLRDVFEFEYPEIAELLHKSESAARQFLHRSRVRARGREPREEADEAYLMLCYRAIEARDPTLLMDMIRVTTARAQSRSLRAARQGRARCASMLVQVNGRYALALVLDGVVLCVVPVGAHTTEVA